MAEIAYLQVTRQCNQHCRFCSSPVNNWELNFEAACRQIAAFKKRNFMGIIFTGGEPTLYPRLDELIAFCRQTGLIPRIITNGQRLAEPGYLAGLKQAGLQDIHLSLQSCREEVHDRLSGNPGSWRNICSALAEADRLEMFLAINTVINRYNADHLDETAAWLLRDYPFIRHFVWNNLDANQEQVEVNRDVRCSLQDFELSLARAARLLISKHRSFRIERVPLCYMAEFAAFSTETRKIIKGEGREIVFLDQRRHFRQSGFFYSKPAVCRVCRLDSICAGVYGGEDFFSYAEIFPVFTDPGAVIASVKKKWPEATGV